MALVQLRSRVVKPMQQVRLPSKGEERKSITGLLSWLKSISHCLELGACFHDVLDNMGSPHGNNWPECQALYRVTDPSQGIQSIRILFADLPHGLLNRPPDSTLLLEHAKRRQRSPSPTTKTPKNTLEAGNSPRAAAGHTSGAVVSRTFRQSYINQETSKCGEAKGMAKLRALVRRLCCVTAHERCVRTRRARLVARTGRRRRTKAGCS